MEIVLEVSFRSLRAVLWHEISKDKKYWMKFLEAKIKQSGQIDLVERIFSIRILVVE